jgi:hypothetical protein
MIAKHRGGMPTTIGTGMGKKAAVFMPNKGEVHLVACL